jgi:hypothetical protein
MNIKQQLTTVTRFSKIIALILFISFPIIGFYLGMKFQESMITSTAPAIAVPSFNPKASSIPTESSLKEQGIVKSGKIEDLVPSGWKIIKQAEGNLNMDNLPDKAVVIEKEVDGSLPDVVPPRSLLIVFKNGNGLYDFFLQSDKAILTADQGGVFGDPFAGLSIKNNLLSLNFYGGSNWRWNIVYYFKYQKDGLYLISKTDNQSYIGVDCVYQENDYDFLTAKRKEITSSRWPGDGDASQIQEDLPCSKTEKSFGIDKKELTNLQNFDINFDLYGDK